MYFSRRYNPIDVDKIPTATRYLTTSHCQPENRAILQSQSLLLLWSVGVELRGPRVIQLHQHQFIVNEWWYVIAYTACKYNMPIYNNLELDLVWVR